MRIPITCHKCMSDELNAKEAERKRAEAAGELVPDRPPGRPLRKEDWHLVELEDDNAYVGTCHNGHTMKTSLQNVRFELLFESGIVAMLMGFNREAVADIIAALERFYEFSIEVFMQRAAIEPGQYDEAWKLMKLSERQLGAFLMLYLEAFKRPFLIGKARTAFDEWTQFRNGVIHQGQFPSATKVQNYARYVYELIRDARRQLKALDPQAVQQVELRNIVRGHEAIEKKVGPPVPDKDGMYWGVSTAGFPMMLSTIVVGEPDDFDSRLANSKKNLSLWGF